MQLVSPKRALITQRLQKPLHCMRLQIATIDAYRARGPERDDKTQHASSRLPPGCYFPDDLDLLILALAVSRPDCGFWLGGGACSASFLGKFVASGGDGQIIWTTSCTFVTLLSVIRRGLTLSELYSE